MADKPTSSQVQPNSSHHLMMAHPVMIVKNDLQATILNLTDTKVIPCHRGVPAGGGGAPTNTGFLFVFPNTVR